MYVMEYIEGGVHENIIDILFEDQKVTLSCAFDENHKCNISYIFFDDRFEMKSHIAYLHSKYEYNYFLSCWLLSDSFLSIKKIKDDICFMFYY